MPSFNRYQATGKNKQRQQLSDAAERAQAISSIGEEDEPDYSSSGAPPSDNTQQGAMGQDYDPYAERDAAEAAQRDQYANVSTGFGTLDENEDGLLSESETGRDADSDGTIEDTVGSDYTNPEMGGAGAEDDDELGYLARIREQQEAERQARQDDLARQRAEAIMDTESRAGLGGMGLSGASAALRNDVARVQDREAALQLADLDRRQRDEEFNAMQRAVAIWDLEEAYGLDIDGDGVTGFPGQEGEEPGQAPTPGAQTANSIEEALSGAASAFDEGVREPVAEFTGRGDVDVNALPGHPDNPVPVGSSDDLPEGSEPAWEDDRGNQVYRAPNGDYYVVKKQDIGARRV